MLGFDSITPTPVVDMFVPNKGAELQDYHSPSNNLRFLHGNISVHARCRQVFEDPHYAGDGLNYYKGDHSILSAGFVDSIESIRSGGESVRAVYIYEPSAKE